MQEEVAGYEVRYSTLISGWLVYPVVVGGVPAWQGYTLFTGPGAMDAAVAFAVNKNREAISGL